MKNKIFVKNPEETLEKLRTGVGMCGCGKELIPAFDKNGKRQGVEHKTMEDDDWHCRYFAGLSLS